MKLKRLYIWAKWRVQSWFLPSAQCPQCRRGEGSHTGDCPMRPGSDDQFGRWNGGKD